MGESFGKGPSDLVSPEKEFSEEAIYCFLFSRNLELEKASEFKSHQVPVLTPCLINWCSLRD